MIKQFHYVDYPDKEGFYAIDIYNDGVKIGSKKLCKADFDDELERLEKDGYRFGYTDGQIADAFDFYLFTCQNRLDSKEQEEMCNKCPYDKEPNSVPHGAYNETTELNYSTFNNENSIYNKYEKTDDYSGYEYETYYDCTRQNDMFAD